MLKVLHTGDLHLGMTHKTRNYPDDMRLQLVEARFKALEKAIDVANKEGCHLLVIAGDLFHSNHVHKTVIMKAAKALELFSGACIAVLPGNHDFYNELAQVWKIFTDAVPENVVLLKDTQPYVLQEYGLDAVLYPGPCDRKHSQESRLGWIKELKEKPQGQWHLRVAHGTVRGVSADFDGRYFPMERDELQKLGLDHIFLGHTHIRFPDVPTADNCGFAYCGTPEPDGFDCAHSGYAWLTALREDKSVQLQSVRTGTYQFTQINVHAQKLDEVTKALAGVAKETLLAKLVVTGRLPQEEFRNRSEHFKELAGLVAYLECDDSKLTMEVSLRSIDAEFPKGSFAHLFLTSLAEREDNEALQMAYELVKKVKKC